MTRVPALLSAAALLLMTSASCLQIPVDYLPDEPLKKYTPSLSRPEVTFSVEQIIDGPFGREDGIATQKVLIQYIGNQLWKSGAFRKVAYKPFSARSHYHIHFIAHYSTLPRNESSLRYAIAAVSLFIVPIRLESDLDMTAIVYRKDKAVYAPAASAGLHNYMWLGFLPAGLVWNNWWAWTVQEKKCSRLLVNRIVQRKQ